MSNIPASLRACAALACVLALAACGGGDDKDNSIRMGGTITGLTTTGLVLSNGATTVSPASGATSFTFPGEYPSDYAFSVAAAQQPLDHTCTITNGDGYTSRDNITNIAVACKQTSFNLGGAVTGLRSDGLVIANGSVTLAIPANATTFTFASKFPQQRSFGVTVLFQPAGATCTVANGAGVMPATDYAGIQISCM